MGVSLSDAGRKIVLSCVDVGEKATLAAAKAHEEIGAASPVDIVKSTAATHAELARKVTNAGASALRRIIA